MSLGVVLVGVPGGSHGTLELYAGRGYDVLPVDVGDGTDVERGLASVESALRTLAARTPAGKLAVVGYGPGGRYAYLAVTRLGADGGAAFHGTGIEAHL